MSFGLKKSFGRICKLRSFKQLYNTGMRPRTFSELLLQLISEEEKKRGYYLFEVPGIAIANPRGVLRVGTKSGMGIMNPRGLEKIRMYRNGHKD